MFGRSGSLGIPSNSLRLGLAPRPPEAGTGLHLLWHPICSCSNARLGTPTADSSRSSRLLLLTSMGMALRMPLPVSRRSRGPMRCSAIPAGAECTRLAAALYPFRQGLMDMSQGILQLFSMEVVGPEQRGFAHSSYQVAYQVALALSASLAGSLIVHMGYAPVFSGAALLYSCALLLLWARFGGNQESC